MTLLVLVYVNNAAIAGNLIVQAEKFKKDIAEKLDITGLGELKWVLGIQVSCDREKHTITTSQTTNIHYILKQLGIQDCAPVSTPLIVKHSLSVAQSPESEEARTEYFKYTKGLHYLEAVFHCYMTRKRDRISNMRLELCRNSVLTLENLTWRH